MRNIGLKCTPLKVTILGKGSLAKKVKTPPQQFAFSLRLSISTGLPLDNFTFEITDVCSSDKDTITNFPMLFKDTSLLMISTLSFETNNHQTHEISLVYPQLIDYNQQGPPILDTFKNNEELSEFMELQGTIPYGDHKVGFDIILDTQAYYGETIESFSCKSENLRIISRSLSENHIVALSNPKIVKIKDISNGENLYEVLEDEGFNLPLSALHQEKSTVLAEKCNPVNLGT